jgi:hypothetical protein
MDWNPEGLVELHKALNRVTRVSGQPSVAQIDEATMTHRDYGDRTSFVTATGAISGAEIFFGDIEDEYG